MDDTNKDTISLVIIGLLPYLYEMGTIVAGPCIFMILLQYRDVIRSTFPWWQIVLAFGVGISLILAIGKISGYSTYIMLFLF